MSTAVTYNGTSYAIPAPGETGWGTQVTNFLLDVGGTSLPLTAMTSSGSVTYTGTAALRIAFTIAAADTYMLASAAFLAVIDSLTVSGFLTVTSGTVYIT